jgi:beta-galactosidase/beta-glucuronidase
MNEYPRPHLRRNLWLNLNGNWSFAITRIKMRYPQVFDRIVRVPFPIESNSSGIRLPIGPLVYLWYKLNFQLRSPIWYEGDHHQYRLILHFDKVDYETVVYLNRHIVGPKHSGGYDPFSYDISPYFMDYQDNELIVRVWDPSNYGYQARGKQQLFVRELNSIYYVPCSGIWGTVWLERVPRVRIDRLQFQTRISSTHVHLKYRIDLATTKTNPSDHRTPNEGSFPTYPKIDIIPNKEDLLDAQRIVKSSENNIGFNLNITIHNLTTLISSKPNIEQEISFPLTKINLWSPENPYLYDIHIDLYQMNVFIERIYSYIGFRQISLCSKTNKICLNNQPYFMLGVLDQGYWSDGLYRPINDDAYRYDIEQMKNLGFNTLRKHMKSEPSRWYYWCDRIGMLVWQDMPAGDSYDGYENESESDKQLRLHRDNRTNYLPIPPPKFDQFSTTPRTNIKRTLKSKIQFEKELKSMIDFLSFHPSIIIWVLFNEGWGQYDTIRLSTWLQSYDQDRLINSASGWQDGFGSGHMRDIHDYTKHILLPSMDNENRALVIGECGGFGLMSSGWSYNSYSDRYLMTYAFEQLILNLSPQISAMIYTQLSDVENESNGILTYDRKENKYISSHIKRVLKNDFSHLYKLQHIWNLTTTPYTNYTSLSLSNSFNVTIDYNRTFDHYFYFYICYLYSQVNITIDHHHTIILNRTHEIRDYHYISLPYDLFRGSIYQEHFLNIHIRYEPSFDDGNDSFVYTNRTYFYLNLAILSE